MDISSVLISIQSLLDMNPLDHEPGFTGKTSEVHENYRDVSVMRDLELSFIGIYLIFQSPLSYLNQSYNNIMNPKSKKY